MAESSPSVSCISIRNTPTTLKVSHQHLAQKLKRLKVYLGPESVCDLLAASRDGLRNKNGVWLFEISCLGDSVVKLINGGRFTAPAQTPSAWYSTMAPNKHDNDLHVVLVSGSELGGNRADKVKFHRAGSLNYHNWRPPLWGRIWQPVQNVILWTLSAPNNSGDVWLCMTFLWVWRASGEDESKSGISFLFFVVSPLFEGTRKGSRISQHPTLPPPRVFLSH